MGRLRCLFSNIQRPSISWMEETVISLSYVVLAKHGFIAPLWPECRLKALPVQNSGVGPENTLSPRAGLDAPVLPTVAVPIPLMRWAL